MPAVGRDLHQEAVAVPVVVVLLVAVAVALARGPVVAGDPVLVRRVGSRRGEVRHDRRRPVRTVAGQVHVDRRHLGVPGEAERADQPGVELRVVRDDGVAGARQRSRVRRCLAALHGQRDEAVRPRSAPIRARVPADRGCAAVIDAADLLRRDDRLAPRRDRGLLLARVIPDLVDDRIIAHLREARDGASVRPGPGGERHQGERRREGKETGEFHGQLLRSTCSLCRRPPRRLCRRPPRRFPEAERAKRAVGHPIRRTPAARAALGLKSPLSSPAGRESTRLDDHAASAGRP